MPFGATETAAAIGAGATLLASGANTATQFALNGNMNLKTRRFAREMYTRQLQDNRENATTAYQRQQELVKMNQNFNRQMTRDELGLKMAGANAAGINPAIALGVSGAAAGGGGAAKAPEAQGAQVNNSANLGVGMPNLGLEGVVELATAKKLEAEANLANTQANTLNGQTPQGEANIANTQASTSMYLSNIDVNDVLKPLYSAQKFWQDLQNKFFQKTQGYRAQFEQWNAYRMKADYEEAVERVNALRIDNQTRAKYNGAILANIIQNTALLLTQGRLNIQELEFNKRNMVNELNYMKWKAENEKDFKQRYTDFLATMRQGQWLNAGASALHSIADITGTILTKGGSKAVQSAGQMMNEPQAPYTGGMQGNPRQPSQTTVNYEWVNGKWIPTKSTETYK